MGKIHKQHGVENLLKMNEEEWEVAAEHIRNCQECQLESQSELQALREKIFGK